MTLHLLIARTPVGPTCSASTSVGILVATVLILDMQIVLLRRHVQALASTFHIVIAIAAFQGRAKGLRRHLAPLLKLNHVNRYPAAALPNCVRGKLTAAFIWSLVSARLTTGTKHASGMFRQIHAN